MKIRETADLLKRRVLEKSFLCSGEWLNGYLSALDDVTEALNTSSEKRPPVKKETIKREIRAGLLKYVGPGRTDAPIRIMDTGIRVLGTYSQMLIGNMGNQSRLVGSRDFASMDFKVDDQYIHWSTGVSTLSEPQMTEPLPETQKEHIFIVNVAEFMDGILCVADAIDDRSESLRNVRARFTVKDNRAYFISAVACNGYWGLKKEAPPPDGIHSVVDVLIPPDIIRFFQKRKFGSQALNECSFTKEGCSYTLRIPISEAYPITFYWDMGVRYPTEINNLFFKEDAIGHIYINAASLLECLGEGLQAFVEQGGKVKLTAARNQIEISGGYNTRYKKTLQARTKGNFCAVFQHHQLVSILRAARKQNITIYFNTAISHLVMDIGENFRAVLAPRSDKQRSINNE